MSDEYDSSGINSGIDGGDFGETETDIIRTSFTCTVKGNTLDSEYDDINPEECFVLHFADIFYTFNIGQLCTVLLIIIILLSIFGKMKEHYRWFLLNQAIWDLLGSIQYICNADLYYYTTSYEVPKCDLVWFFGDEYTYMEPFAPDSPYRYRYTTMKRIADVYLDSISSSLPYSALFLLSASRFFAIFFSNFYERITKHRRLLYIFLIFTIFNLLIYAGQILDFILENYINDLHKAYGVPPLALVYRNPNFTWPFNCSTINCFYEKDTLLLIGFKTNEILFHVQPALTYFYIIFSIIVSIALMTRIGIQAKFQLKHNRRDFFVSFRISTVIFFQTFLLAALFSIFFIDRIPNFLTMVFGVEVQTATTTCRPNSTCIDFTLPKWIDGQYGIQSNAVTSTIRELRILLECIFVLFIMAGYFEALKSTVKFCYLFIRHPKQAFREMKAKTLSSKVITLTA